MISDRAARYAIGYVIGAAHERAGIIDLEEGYPCDEMYRAGMRRGRADFRRAIDSLLIPEEQAQDVEQEVPTVDEARKRSN